MTDQLTLLSAVILGLMGGVHCIGMCGGISAALGLSGGQHSYRKLLAYNLGRISSYTMMGAIAGLASGLLQEQWMLFGIIMRIAANLLLILMGFYLANWWYGLSWIERIGHHLWRRIQPLGRFLLPVEHSAQALFLGMLWGWLPCGLIYSALAWTSTAGSAQQSGILMLAFGIGTLPAMLTTGLFANQLRQHLQRKNVRVIAGLLIISFGCYGLAELLPHQWPGGEEKASHMHHH